MSKKLFKNVVSENEFQSRIRYLFTLTEELASHHSVWGHSSVKYKRILEERENLLSDLQGLLGYATADGKKRVSS